MNKRIKSTFSWILVISILMSVMSGTVCATGTEPNEVVADVTLQTPSVDLQTPEVAESAPTILEEDVSLRGEYEKHFLMSDGSYQATVYDEPVHQLIEGMWEEVDNTLALSVNKDGVSQYKTANGITDVSFTQSFQNKLVTIEQEEYAISWDVDAVLDNTSIMSNTPAQTAAALQTTQAEVIPANFSGMSLEDQKTIAVKSSSTIQYSNALAQGVDLKYTVLPSRVKEDIILQTPQSISSFVVNVYTENLSARLLENREIEFFNSNNQVVFTMYAPYMYDSAGELSENIAVGLTSKGNGQYIMTMVPDAQWLSDSGRIYPIVIDPYVSPSNAKSNIIDNYVLEGSDSVQNSKLDRLYVGKKSGYTARTYLKYRAMPYIPVPSRIDAAYQRLEITSGTSTTNPIDIYTVTGGDWASGTISGNNKPDALSILQSSVPASTDSSNGELIYYFSCSAAVRTWYSGSTIGKNCNYGIMIRYSDESINDYNAFYSADCTTASNRPSLSIHYTIPTVEESTIVWPAPGHNAYDDITSEWGYRTYDDEMHYGIDISCYNLRLVAAISGTVSTSYNSSAGYTLTIQKTGSDFQVRYYHLKQDGYIATAGSVVNVGDYVAISGNTGSSSGPHLHFQLQYGNDKNKSYNPLDIYHPDDTRSAWTNPNPMFYLVDGFYVPNEYFNYTYTPSSYNNTVGESWKK